MPAPRAFSNEVGAGSREGAAAEQKPKAFRRFCETVKSFRPNLSGTLTILAVAGLWEAAVRSGAIAFDYLPAPSAVFVAWVQLLLSGEMLVQTAHTLRAVLIGWVVASAIGIGLGLVLGFSALGRRYLLASLEVLRPLPAVAFLPLALLLFNFSLTTELVLIIYASIWPALINTMGGVMSVRARLYDVARTLRLSRAHTLIKVIMPAAAPAIVVGCRLSLGLTLVMAIIAEMLANPHGLGYAVVSELQAMQPQRMFAYVFFIGLLAIALNGALIGLSRRFLRGHAAARHD
jgi:ABC-type nitrate/sulfonate/bicarbonate transport system permease component